MKILAGLLAVSVSGAITGGALLDAARDDDKAAVAALIGQKADVNAREADGATALSWAAMRGNAAMAELLLKAGADPNLTNELGIGPLSIAIANDSAPMVKLLLASGGDPNVARENGETPLMTAARMGQAEILKLLLDRGARVNDADRKFHQNALMWGAGHPEAVRLLVDRGADLKAVTKAWDVKYVIYAPTTVTLGKTGIPWNTDGEYTTRKGGQNALFFAVQSRSVESARLLVDAGIDVNSTSADGTTPLLAALYKWNAPKSTFIPGRGAPAAAGSSQRFGADVAMARFLLDRGAKVKVTDGAGYTPLHGAALAVASIAGKGRKGGAYGRSAAALNLGSGGDGSLEDALAMAAALLDAGADPNAQTQYPTAGPAGDVRINPAPPGSSPFHVAASSGSLALVRLLGGRKADPNLVRKDGHTPFSVAVLTGDVPVIQELVARGANVQARFNPKDKIPDPVEAITLPRQNQTILHIAAIAGSPAVIEYLASQGAPLNEKNAQGETPLDLCDHQERYRDAIQRQGAEGDAEKLKTIHRGTAGTDAFQKLLVR